MMSPGIYTNIPFDEYRKWDAVHNTLLSNVQGKSPFHAKYYKEHPSPDTPAFFIGRAAHCLALEPDKFDQRYTMFGGRRAGKVWAEFVSKANGKVVLTESEYESIKQVAESIKQQVVHRFIQQGEAEVCIVWTDKETGLLCKARLDYVHRERAFIIDLKTTRDAALDQFQRAMWTYRYYQQAAFYSDGWKALTGDPTVFVFLPVEKDPPYAVAAYEVHDNTIWAGRLEYRKALETWAECVKTGVYPSYADSVEMINLTDWALKESGVDKYRVLTEV